MARLALAALTTALYLRLPWKLPSASTTGVDFLLTRSIIWRASSIESFGRTVYTVCARGDIRGHGVSGLAKGRGRAGSRGWAARLGHQVDRGLLRGKLRDDRLRGAQGRSQG